MDRMKPTHDRLTLPSSGLVAALTVIGTIVMLTSRSDGLLTAYGLQNLKFFTVDSNLFLGLVCVAELLLAVLKRVGWIRRIPAWIETLHFIATVAVALTFIVVVVFFGPSVGYAPLFQDANLYFHLIVPVLAMVFFCTLHRGRFLPMKKTVLALVPSVLYGLYYTSLLLIHGVHFPDTDWYGFASGGLIGSVITAAGILLVTWGLALLLRLAAGGTKRQARRHRERAGTE